MPGPQEAGACGYFWVATQRGRRSWVPAVPSPWGSVPGAASEGPRIPALCLLPSVWLSRPGHGPITLVGDPVPVIPASLGTPSFPVTNQRYSNSGLLGTRVLRWIQMARADLNKSINYAQLSMCMCV